MLVKRKQGLPEGFFLVKEDLALLVEKIHLLKDQDLQELNAFADYLLEGSDTLAKARKIKSLKIFDFMAAGMERTA
jgi:hypothetical protein